MKARPKKKKKLDLRLCFLFLHLSRRSSSRARSLLSLNASHSHPSPHHHHTRAHTLQGPRRPPGRSPTTLLSHHPFLLFPQHTSTATTGVARNPNFAKLQAGYLFPEIARRRRAHAESRPDARIISLGIGDTTEPIPPTTAKAMSDSAAGLGTLDGYSGYGAEQGRPELRKAICDRFYAQRGGWPTRLSCLTGQSATSAACK